MGDRTNARESAGKSVLVLSTKPGTGHLCDACHQVIEPTHVECRTHEKSDSDSDTPAESLRLHQWCYYARFASNR
jgi:hypothetical protein